MSPLKAENRSAKRFEAKIRMIISSLTTDDLLKDTPVEALSVSRTGLKLKCPKLLREGMYVRLTRPGSEQSKMARVIWAEAREKGVTFAGLALAMQLRDPSDFWGVEFPTSDRPDSYFWQEEVAPGEPRVDSPAASTATAAELPPLEIAASGAKVLVRGLSAARVPFQEESLLMPAGEDEGTVSIRPVVDYGRLMYVLFLAEGKVVKARVAGASRRQGDGRFKTWLRFEQPVRIIPANPSTTT